MLDKRFLDELRGRLTLSEIVGRRVKITRAGREFKGCCPFHNEKTPSFYVNDEKGFFHCFGCGAHGDAVSFRMRHDNVTFMDAVESLASEAGLTMPRPDPQSAEKFDRDQKLYGVLDRVSKWFEGQLHHPQNGFALRYLRDRGLTDDTIARFRLGYAPNSWDAARDAWVQSDLKIDDLIALGLLRKSTREDKADKPYAFFRGRVMFPVTDARGRVIAYGGRHLDAAFTGQTLSEKPPKYINSAEHALFNKSAVLYAMAQARANINAQNPLILVEGYMDVISLHQAGVSTAVAPLGTALTEEHMALAWKASPPGTAPILCFDGDNAGQNAAYRAIERILPHMTAQKSMRLAFLPSGEDPDSLVAKNGAAGFRAVLDAAVGVFDALWAREYAQTPQTPEGRAALQARMDDHIRKVADPVLQQNYRQTLRDRMFQAGRSNTQRGGAKTNRPAPVRPVHIRKPSQDLEKQRWRVILTTAINHPYLIEQDAELLGVHSAPEPALDRVREALVTLAHQDRADTVLTPETVQDFLSEQQLGGIVTDLLSDSTYQLFGFARPGADAEAVLDGWKDVWKHMQLKTVSRDKSRLLQAVRTGSDSDAADRLYALSQQEQNLLDDTV